MDMDVPTAIGAYIAVGIVAPLVAFQTNPHQPRKVIAIALFWLPVLIGSALIGAIELWEDVMGGHEKARPAPTPRAEQVKAVPQPTNDTDDAPPAPQPYRRMGL